MGIDYGSCVKLLGKCFRLSELGDDTFFEYSPHIGCVNIAMYRGRWSKDAKRSMYYFVGPRCETSVDQMIAIMDERIKELTNGSGNKE